MLFQKNKLYQNFTNDIENLVNKPSEPGKFNEQIKKQISEITQTETEIQKDSEFLKNIFSQGIGK